MAYTEALFVLLAIGVLLGIERRWPLLVLALITGIATVTRPTGVALVLPFAMGVWRRASSIKAATAQLILLLPLSCWGLIAYMAYQAACFGNPLEFVHAQMQVRARPPLPLIDRALALLS